MPCYCANYYVRNKPGHHPPSKFIADNLPKGSINCHNTVQRFGDRCKHCLVNGSFKGLKKKANTNPNSARRATSLRR